MNAPRTLWHDILLVWTFFTRIPAPHFMTERTLSQALWALPLVGLILPLLQVLAVALILYVFGAVPPIFLAILIVGIGLISTGALHWDGWADFCDGLGVSKARRAEVMRDSSLGTFGALGLIALLSLQVWGFSALIQQGVLNLNVFFFVPTLFIAALVSRALMGLTWAFLPGMDTGSQAVRLGQPSKPLHFIYGILAVILMMVYGPSFWHLLFLLILIAGFIWFLYRSLGGISGDGLGSIQVVSETMIVTVYTLVII